MTESCQESQCHCGHRATSHHHHHHHHHHLNHHPNHHLNYLDSGRSETSADEATTSCRNAYREPIYHHGPPIPHRNDNPHFKILDLDPDGIQVMGEVDLQHLPDAVNKEILKNSREIIFEEPETSREGSPLLLLKSNRRNSAAKHPLLDEERRSLNSSKRSLCHRSILRGCFEEEKRSLDGSRRNLHGSRKYLLIPIDASKESGGKENFAKRQMGESRECLNGGRRMIWPKSKETAEPETRRRLNSNDDRLMIEMEKSSKCSASDRREMLNEACGASLSYPNLSPRSKDGQSPVPPVSNASPESGFYEASAQWNSSPEYGRKPLRLPPPPNESPVIARNRRSYENAQLQDVNEVLGVSSRPSSDNSDSLDSETSTKNPANDGDAPPRRYGEKKQPISYTSV